MTLAALHYYALLPHLAGADGGGVSVERPGPAAQSMESRRLLTGASASGASAEEGGGGGALGSWVPHKLPVQLELRLPKEVLKQPDLATHKKMFRQYGFNLNLSNHIPLLRKVPDLRNAACKARQWPSPEQVPKASVIIIFYNEPLSTLLRNVIGVLNRSPPKLLGEVLLVDDHSALPEVRHLGDHLERLTQQLPPGKVRLVRREVHDGIVGARNRGVKEAIYPIVVILDSHAEVTHGWLEPLVGRIHEDRTRVVVPNIVPINIETMAIEGGNTWPPLRGSFNWRLSFTILVADAELDLVEPAVDKTCSAIKTPVMPGGLFAMDREYFLQLGEYDPEIQYYGAEHVEMSFRVWMCGGTMEIAPCSHIGHIYREFDRFGVDTQLRGVNIAAVLDRNDARVAEVWMDDYKRMFYKYRPIKTWSLGDLQPRRDLRKRLQCKPFQWFLDNVCRDMYVPDPAAPSGQVATIDGSLCLDNEGHWEGQVQLRGCRRRSENQRLELTSKGYLQFSSHFDHKLICIRIQVVSQVSCSGAPSWTMKKNGAIESFDKPGLCLDRGRGNSGEEPELQRCSGIGSQRWLHKRAQGSNGGTVSDPSAAVCVDNMQRTSGPPGLYPCHAGPTQQWLFQDSMAMGSAGKLRSSHSQGDGVCLGFAPAAGVATCVVDDPNFLWLADGPVDQQRLRPSAAADQCLEQVRDGSGGNTVQLRSCREGTPEQRWKLAAGNGL